MNGQLTIEACQEMARQNYPQVRQFDLIQQSADYNLSNAGKNWLPQVSLSARATYQSDATSISVPQLSLDITLPKDQYQAVLEATQLVWDGGVNTSQKNIIKATAAVDKEKLEVELYTLKDRVNQVFFGLLLIEDQLLQNRTLQEELQTNYDRVNAYVVNGVANQADLDAISVEKLNNQQRRLELIASEKSFRQMLSALTGKPISETTNLIKPLPVYAGVNLADIKRPELRLFDSQLNLLNNQENMVRAGNLPKLGLFLQGGYGNPGLNMFKEGFSAYYLGGIRLSWTINGFYTQKNNLRTLENTKDGVAVQRETFLFNNNLIIVRQNNEIEKIREQLKQDDEIIRLRGNIKQASSVKVENGTMTVADLLRDINAENLAKTQRSLHEIQLLMAVNALKYSVNQ